MRQREPLCGDRSTSLLLPRRNWFHRLAFVLPRIWSDRLHVSPPPPPPSSSSSSFSRAHPQLCPGFCARGAYAAAVVLYAYLFVVLLFVSPSLLPSSWTLFSLSPHTVSTSEEVLRSSTSSSSLSSSSSSSSSSSTSTLGSLSTSWLFPWPRGHDPRYLWWFNASTATVSLKTPEQVKENAQKLKEERKKVLEQGVEGKAHGAGETTGHGSDRQGTGVTREAEEVEVGVEMSGRLWSEWENADLGRSPHGVDKSVAKAWRTSAASLLDLQAAFALWESKVGCRAFRRRHERAHAATHPVMHRKARAKASENPNRPRGNGGMKASAEASDEAGSNASTKASTKASTRASTRASDWAGIRRRNRRRSGRRALLQASIEEWWGSEERAWAQWQESVQDPWLALAAPARKRQAAEPSCADMRLTQDDVGGTQPQPKARRHVLVHVRRPRWLQQSVLEGLHWCPRCGIACEWVWSDARPLPRADAELYVDRHSFGLDDVMAAAAEDTEAGATSTAGDFFPLASSTAADDAPGFSTLAEGSSTVSSSSSSSSGGGDGRGGRRRPLRVLLDIEAPPPSVDVSSWADIVVGFDSDGGSDVVLTYANVEHTLPAGQQPFRSRFKRQDVPVYRATSNCEVPFREELASNILSRVPHHSFGGCLNNMGQQGMETAMYKHCAHPLVGEQRQEVSTCAQSHYKFVLAIENHLVPGYVTEKLYNALLAGAVPIYLGAPDVASFAPPDSFIDLSKFKSWEELTSTIRAIHRDPVRYMRYHAWRACGVWGNFTRAIALGFSSLPCRLCEKVASMA